MKRILLIALLLNFTFVKSQNSLNANFQPLKFGGTGVSISNKVGNGTNVGDVVLYQNIIAIGNTNIDAVVKTVSINNASFTSFDQTATSGTGYSGNQAQWFSPQLSFNNGGGNVVFLFTLIQGGTYNNSTKTGSRITLNNVRINTYDIDGNGNANSNQFNEFGGFSTSELSNQTNITPTYNEALGLTKYRSNLSSNTSDATDVKNRVRVTYNFMSEFNISVGAGSSGAAYFFIDFSTGSTFTGSVSTSAPQLDLNTLTNGINNDTSLARNGHARFATGQNNISNPSNVVNSFKLFYSLSTLPDSSSELVIFNNAISGGSYPLFFSTSGSNNNLVLQGVTYTVTRSVSGNNATMMFTKQGGGTITNAQAENFIDAMFYQNTKVSPTTGNRTFQITFTNPTFESPPAQYTLNLAQQLPVSWSEIKTVKNEDHSVLLKWKTESESNCSFFEPLLFLPNAFDWKSAGKISASNVSSGSWYSFPIENQNVNNYIIKIKQVDFDGTYSYSPSINVEFKKSKNYTYQYFNGLDLIKINSNISTHATVVDQFGRVVKQIVLRKGDNELRIEELSNGLYWINIDSVTEKFLKY